MSAACPWASRSRGALEPHGSWGLAGGTQGRMLAGGLQSQGPWGPRAKRAIALPQALESTVREPTLESHKVTAKEDPVGHGGPMVSQLDATGCSRERNYFNANGQMSVKGIIDVLCQILENTRLRNISFFEKREAFLKHFWNGLLERGESIFLAFLQICCFRPCRGTWKS